MKLNPVRLLSEMPNKKGELLVPVFIKFGFLNIKLQNLSKITKMGEGVEGAGMLVPLPRWQEFDSVLSGTFSWPRVLVHMLSYTPHR